MRAATSSCGLAVLSTSSRSSPPVVSAISRNGPSGRGVNNASHAPHKIRADLRLSSEKRRNRSVFPTPASPPTSTSRPRELPATESNDCARADKSRDRSSSSIPGSDVLPADAPMPSDTMLPEACYPSRVRRSTYTPAACRPLMAARFFVGDPGRSGSAHRFLHERADLCLFGGGQLLQREGGWPHGAFVEVRLVAEAERRIPRLELLRALEEADDIAVLCVRRHPVPGSRREVWRAGFDEGMEPLGHGAIRFRHLGDLRKHVAFPVRLARAPAAARGRLQLLGALPHRGSFLVRESLGRLAGGALGGLLRARLCRLPLSHCEAPPCAERVAAA